MHYPQSSRKRQPRETNVADGCCGFSARRLAAEGTWHGADGPARATKPLFVRADSAQPCYVRAADS
jgi:hypothetical protein